MAYDTMDKNAVRALQRQLNAAGANLAVDGIWGEKTQAAYQRYGGGAAAGAQAPWTSEAQRRAANAAHVASFGLDPDKSYPLLDGQERGVYGADGLGGVFNPLGYSSNPNYLYTVAGVTRDQLQGTPLAGFSDLALGSVVSTIVPFANDLYIHPVTGAASSAPAAGMVSLGEARRAYAALTGQQPAMTLGMGGEAAPFVQPQHHTAAQRQQGLAALQQQIIQQRQAALNTGTYTGDPRYFYTGLGGAARGGGAGAAEDQPAPTLIEDIMEQLRRKQELERYQQDIWGRTL